MTASGTCAAIEANQRTAKGMKVLTPLRAIRARCLECAGSRKKVRDCGRGPEASDPCVLHPYRMGRNPARKGIGRAMSSEDARFTQKRTSQVVSFGKKNSAPCPSTPEINLGHPRAKFGQFDFSDLSPRERRRIRESALEILLGPEAREQHGRATFDPGEGGGR